MLKVVKLHGSRASSDGMHVHYVLEPDTLLTRAMLDAVLSGPPPAQLAALAERRLGFGNSDGGFGVVYHGDLDEYDRVNSPIREGFVQVYGYFGPPEGYEYEIPETVYLEFLSAFLRANGQDDDAGRVERVRVALRGT